MGLLVRGRLTRLRPATADDVERLVAWHADPDVSRYWDEETFTRDEMAERLARPDVDAWIVDSASAKLRRRVRRQSVAAPDMRGRGILRSAAAGARCAHPRAGKRSEAERGEAATAGEVGADGVPFRVMRTERTSTPR